MSESEKEEFEAPEVYGRRDRFGRYKKMGRYWGISPVLSTVPGAQQSLQEYLGMTGWLR